MENAGLGLRLSRERQPSWEASCASSPLWCGFAPTTPPASVVASAAAASAAGLVGWDSSASGELARGEFEKFQELWDAKWSGDSTSMENSGKAKRRVINRNVHSASAGTPVARKVSGDGLVVQRSSRSVEKFQLAAGFEDWGIPPYPEDYVDPAELSYDSDSYCY